MKSEFHIQKNKDWNMSNINEYLDEVASEFHIQKNKDWNTYIPGVWFWATFASEFHIQKNKDWNLYARALAEYIKKVWIPYPEKQGLKLEGQL